MRKAVLIAALALALAGCAGNVKLISEGKVYQGKYESVTKTMEADIDGVAYKGTYVTDTSTTGGGFYSKGKWVSMSTTTGGTAGRALLTSADNKVLRCEFMVGSMSAQGTCQDSNGRTYDLVTQ